MADQQEIQQAIQREEATQYAIFRREQTNYIAANASGGKVYDTREDAVKALVETNKSLPTFMHHLFQIEPVKDSDELNQTR
jgi:hypothetical protein